MSKNAIVVTNIDYDDIAKYTIPYFEQYSKKTGADLLYITEKSINVKGAHYPNLRFENLQVLKYFELYDRIFLVDCDVIIKPSCPDYFLLDPDSIYVTRLDKYNGYTKWVSDVIEDVQNQIGVVQWNDNFYFNSGVMLFSKIHKEVFNVDAKTLSKVQGNTRVQNYINWKVQKLNYKLTDLGPVFNFRASEKIFGGIEKGAAHILHYLGDKSIDSVNFKTLVNDSEKFNNQPTTKSII